MMGCILRNARVDFSIKYTLDEKNKDIIIDNIVKSLVYEDNDTEEWRVHEIDTKHVIKYSYLPTIKKKCVDRLFKLRENGEDYGVYFKITFLSVLKDEMRLF